ncbi:hypothetical protein [Tortoise microvirus 41]|nr:hypothetical protein [Tortoise microvirus 41]
MLVSLIFSIATSLGLLPHTALPRRSSPNGRNLLLEYPMYNVCLDDGSILGCKLDDCHDVHLLMPRLLVEAIDNVIKGDTMTLQDFIRLACAEYLFLYGV